MADSPSHTPASPTPNSDLAGAGDDVADHWCYHCNKRVSVETMPNEPDVICHECKNGFVESIQPNPIEEEATFGSQLLQMLRIVAQAAREDDSPPSEEPPPPRARSVEDFLRIEMDGWGNHDDDEEDEEDARGGGEGGDGNNDRNNGHESDNDEDDTDEDYAEYLTRRRRDILRVRIRDLATRSNRSGRNRILDWAEILMGLEDNSIEFRLEVPESESDRYIGNPEDYLDAAGFEELLQNLAESDGGRRGAPPAAKAAVLGLPKVEILSESDTVVCAICKDSVKVGEFETKLPCGHGYHGDCIVPWLGSRNSCPVCRFELETDDVEYEEERKKRLATARGNAGSSAAAGGGGNSADD